MTPEDQTRYDLATVYRLMARLGWDDLMFGHATARIPGTDHILVNQWGLAFHEITPENLVKVSVDGQVIGDQSINPAGFVIHGVIHKRMPHVGGIIHTHSISGAAVAADSRGLLPISQISLSARASLAYHDYQGIFVDTHEQDSLISDLGDKNMMIMRNHGLLALGPDIRVAAFRMYILQTACEIQMRCNHDHLQLISVEAQQNHASRVHALNSQVDWGAAWHMLTRLANDK